MLLSVSYMGMKRQLAPIVADVISFAPPGPLLDLFSGICSVGSAVAPKRQVWCNDVQVFASRVAEAFFTSANPSLTAQTASELVLPFFSKNFRALQHRFKIELRREKKVLDSRNILALKDLDCTLPDIRTCQKLDRERRSLSKTPNSFPYRLFTITYSGGYFSLNQCLEIDSLKYSIDQLLSAQIIDADQKRWMDLALCQAASKVSNTTGHFAQYLKAKESNKQRVFAQKNRSIWVEWLSAMNQCKPIGSATWRQRNKVFNDDALTVLEKIKNKIEKPSVIYADPPYTSDQYSRYYHVFETILLYDYPSSKGVGRYRPDRFSSDFSLKSRVASALSDLFAETAELGSCIVLSYPDNGLLPEPRRTIPKLLRENFRKVIEPRVVTHYHSSLGASKGYEKNRVTEVVYYASN